MSAPRRRAPKVPELPADQRCRRLDGSYKASYRSKAKARQGIRGHKNLNGVKLYPYRCVRCGWWHVSHEPPRNADSS